MPRTAASPAPSPPTTRTPWHCCRRTRAAWKRRCPRPASRPNRARCPSACARATSSRTPRTARARDAPGARAWPPPAPPPGPTSPPRRRPRPAPAAVAPASISRSRGGFHVHHHRSPGRRRRHNHLEVGRRHQVAGPELRHLPDHADGAAEEPGPAEPHGLHRVHQSAGPVRLGRAADQRQCQPGKADRLAEHQHPVAAHQLHRQQHRGRHHERAAAGRQGGVQRHPRRRGHLGQRGDPGLGRQDRRHPAAEGHHRPPGSVVGRQGQRRQPVGRRRLQGGDLRHRRHRQDRRRRRDRLRQGHRRGVGQGFQQQPAGHERCGGRHRQGADRSRYGIRQLTAGENRRIP
ncbi:hypothetical protein MTBUT4_340014 [Magnetospirillum sp. UT-4]|nr:hypothetical protein MTBUT4_340014 [Magnetospirillum sp. UT-4]